MEEPKSQPVACRFIPYDQWLVTHVDPKWKIKHVKHWILKKCGAPGEFDIPQRERRPPSPIIFAPAAQKHSSRGISPIQFNAKPSQADEDDGGQAGYEEDNEVSEAEWTPIVRPKPHHTTAVAEHTPSRRRSKSSKQLPLHKISAYEPDRLVILRFSTGQLLEDDYTFDWYEMEPYELIEVHRAGVFLRLPRTSPTLYVQPYWEGWVQALRVVGPANRRSNDGEVQKLEWRRRWVVVHKGHLALCKDRTETFPAKQLSLSCLTDLRGADHLERSTSIVPEANQRIICAKFKISIHQPPPPHEEHHKSVAKPVLHINTKGKPRKRASTISHTPVHLTHDQGGVSESTNPDGGEDSESTLSDAVFAHDDISDDDNPIAARESNVSRGYRYGGSYPKSQQPAVPPPSAAIPTAQAKEIGEWIVLDLPDDNAYTSLLRTLHRLFPHDTQSISHSSTFVSGLLPALESPPKTPKARPRSMAFDPKHQNLPRANPLGAMPFPEWRTELFRRARKVGLGNITHSLGGVLSAMDLPPPPPSSDIDSEHKIEISSVRIEDDDDEDAPEPPTTPSDGGDMSALLESSSDSDDSQVEWEGWMADLHRQARQPPIAEPNAILNVALDVPRQNFEPTAQVLTSPSSHESLYRRSLRAAEQRRPSMPTILFAPEPSGSHTHTRQASSLSQRPSMPSLGRTTSISAMKREKEKDKKKSSKKGKERERPMSAEANPAVVAKKRSGLARGVEKIVRGLDPTLDFVDTRRD
ncbi:hypothetical protein CYLTODRAFT_442992 [Cylindrobasidium torrendii FP15055 ss-10]|uniref:Uncharacterized protein n=1 Tax=Cylindrobasidium torrendii FP15055 ss-10 TaxID=1314674 RepID=A0A0D7BEQ5_9AGAR|nr:hypothetical protein CYLTODRAFT_442992 [Cylindrobasidium torrendii FP15055 ss-10]